MDVTRAERHLQAGLKLEGEGRERHAEREYRRALDLAPRHVVALNSLGLLLATKGRAPEAAALFERATVAHPQDAVSWSNHGAMLHALGREPEAIESFAQAIRADPAAAPARLNLANLLRSQGRLDEARPHYLQLLDSNPRDGLARWNLGALEGLSGHLDRAFQLFALHHAFNPAGPTPRLPRWRGEALAGRRILLDADQGLGDTIMFARFIPAVAARGGRVVLRAQRELQPLLAGLPGLEACVPRDGDMPHADLWYPLVDLPAVLGEGSAAGPWPRRYLAAPEKRRAAWSAQLPQTGALRVGLVWAGNPTHPDDRNRSIPLETLQGPLAAVEGVSFVSLQVGAARAAGQAWPGLRQDIVLADFADTAAVLETLDLVISVDTSVLHLAGALGRPAWGLVPFAPDWRWMLGRRDTPWYPGMVLFRQPRPRDWRSVAAEVADALALAVRTGMAE